MLAINPMQYGINQIIQTARLNLWKFLNLCSFPLIKDIVAQVACKSINTMAKIPVMAWMFRKFWLLIVDASVVINVVPVVSKMKPAQKNARCFGLRILASLSLQTPIE